MRGFRIIDVVDDISKPFLGIDVVFFASAEETVKHSDVFGCFMVSCKQEIFSFEFMESFP